MIIAAIMTIIKIMIMKISCALRCIAAFSLICVLPADGIEELEFSGEGKIQIATAMATKKAKRRRGVH